MSSYRDEFSSTLRDARWSFWRIFWTVIGAGILVSAIMVPVSLCTETVQVAREELGPRALLAKYGWFKDAAAQLARKDADLRIVEAQIAAANAGMGGKPVYEWPRDAREQLSVWAQQLAGMKSSRNDLAAEFNAAHSKINWAFADVGKVPHGCEALPREFRDYLEK